MADAQRIALGSLAGAAVAALISPFLRPLFPVPTGGVGFVTVHQYAKGWDYAVVGLLVTLTAIGGVVASRFAGPPGEAPGGWRAGRPRAIWGGAAIVFVLMLFAHDHPYAIMNSFHEGEHLAPAFLLRSGERPYRDVFFLHGFGVDGGLDAMVLGDPPSPRRERRLETVLDAATLALLVPIAAEVAGGWWVAAAAVASLCGVAAGQLPVFPWFRLAPVLLAALGLLRYARSGSARPLFLAFAASTLGVLWSLDTGLYALAGTAVAFAILPKHRRWIPLALAALALPFALLFALRADVGRFLHDSFVVIPSAIDAVWSLPAPATLTLETARYYVPPVFYGLLLALAWSAWRGGDRAAAARIAIVAILSIVAFRTAAGRAGWSHTRYGTPLFGLAAVAFVIEPMGRARRRVAAVIAAVALAVLVELPANAVAGAKLLAGWRGRQSHAGLVPYPLATGKGIYTTPQDSADLASLNGFLGGAPFLDFSGERALYYLLQRKPPLRCPDINMLSSPLLFNEAIAELEARRPPYVIVKGTPGYDNYDGVPHRERVPELAAWIDANYPRRVEIGRFVVAARQDGGR